MMYFGTPAKLATITNDSIMLSGGNIEVVQAFKYLGLMLDGRAELYRRSNILPLETQRMINKSCIVYIGINQESTKFVNNLFSLSESDSRMTTRSELNRKLTAPDIVRPSTKVTSELEAPCIIMDSP